MSLSLRHKFFWFFLGSGLLCTAVGLSSFIVLEKREAELLLHHDTMVSEFRLLGELKASVFKGRILWQSSEHEAKEMEEWNLELISLLESYESLISVGEDGGLLSTMREQLPQVKQWMLGSNDSRVVSTLAQWESLVEQAMVNELDEMAEERLETRRASSERLWVMVGALLLLLTAICVMALFLAERLTRNMSSLTESVRGFDRNKTKDWPVLDGRWSDEERLLLLSFIKLIDNLEDSEHRREELQRFLVHDLNGVITSLQLSVDLSELHGKAMGMSMGSPLEQSLSSIRASCLGMSAMVSDLYETGELKQGKLKTKLEDFELLDLVESWLDRHRPAMALAGVDVDLVLPEGKVVKGDAYLLGRVFQNLWLNSLRQLPEGGNITIRWEERSGDECSLLISDNGPGLPKTLGDQIFSEGVQGEKGMGRKGLGLAFCKRAMEAMGGSIEIVDTTVGAMFRVTLKK